MNERRGFFLEKKKKKTLHFTSSTIFIVENVRVDKKSVQELISANGEPERKRPGKKKKKKKKKNS